MLAVMDYISQASSTSEYKSHGASNELREIHQIMNGMFWKALHIMRGAEICKNGRYVRLIAKREFLSLPVRESLE